MYKHLAHNSQRTLCFHYKDQLVNRMCGIKGNVL